MRPPEFLALGDFVDGSREILDFDETIAALLSFGLPRPGQSVTWRAEGWRPPGLASAVAAAATDARGLESGVVDVTYRYVDVSVAPARPDPDLHSRVVAASVKGRHDAELEYLRSVSPNAAAAYEVGR